MTGGAALRHQFEGDIGDQVEDESGGFIIGNTTKIHPRQVRIVLGVPATLWTLVNIFETAVRASSIIGQKLKYSLLEWICTI
jgi:hypothetical protein